MTSFVAFHSIDTADFGRFNADSLSDQSRMELLITGFENQSDFREENGEFTEISKLDSVEQNDDGQVTSIDIVIADLRGTLDMRYFPLYLERVDMIFNGLKGNFQATLIPAGTRFVRLAENKLEGSVELFALPKHIRYLNLSDNLLSGTLDCSHIPDALESLHLSKNQLSGRVDVSKITMRLSIEKTGIESAWNNMPIKHWCPTFWLNLSDNNFSGVIRVSEIARLDGVGMFSNNACEEIMDLNGDRKAIFQ